MNIYDALKQTSARVSDGSRWLIMEEDGTYIVCEHQYGRKKSTIIIETDDEEKAVAALLEREQTHGRWSGAWKLDAKGQWWQWRKDKWCKPSRSSMFRLSAAAEERRGKDEQ